MPMLMLNARRIRFPFSNCAWLLLLGCFLGACTSKPEVVKSAPLQSIEDPLKFKVYWKKDIGSPFEVGSGPVVPLVSADKILIADGNSRVRALSVHKGREQWSRKFKRQFGGGIGGDETELLFASLDGTLSLLELHTGEPIWEVQASSEIVTPVAVSDARVMVQSVDGRVQAFDRASGEPQWQYRSNVPLLSLRGNAAPQIHDDQVIAAFADGSLVALDLDTGLVNWQHFVAMPSGRTELERLVDVDGAFAVSGSLVYAVSYQGKAMAVDLYTGDLVWEKALSSVAGLIAHGGRVFVVDDQSHVWALNARNGEVSWVQTQLQARGLGAPVIVGNYLVVSDDLGYVHWLDPSEGVLRGRKRLGKGRLTLVSHTWVDPDENSTSQPRLIAVSSRAKLVFMGLR